MLMKNPTKQKIFIFLICTLAFTLFIFIADTVVPDGLLPVASRVSAADDMERAKFLLSYGWEVSTVPIEVVEVTIPTEFNEVYEKYNQLQISQGFDLSGYKGKAVTRYTYSIINYPDGIENVRANVLVYKNKVIGGDICTLDIKGFMHTFDGSADETGIMNPTFYVMSEDV